MSARRLSIDRRMTLPPGGGPFVDGGRGGGRAGTQPALFATIADATVEPGAAGAEALATLPAAAGTGAAETPGGGASFEQAAASTAPEADRIRRRMAREHYCPPGRVPSNRSRRPAGEAERKPQRTQSTQRSRGRVRRVCGRARRDLRQKSSAPSASSAAFFSSGVDRDPQLLAELQVRLADAVEDDLLAAILARDARGVLGGAHDLHRDPEVVREQEPGAIGCEVDRGHPLLQIDRPARLQELRDVARQELALHTDEVGRHEGERLVDLTLQVRPDRELRHAQPDRGEEPRLEPRPR